MRTTKQWLAERELGLEAAKVLVPGPWKHKWNGSGAICCDCLNCGVMQRSRTRKEDCPVPDPIDVNDWNVAKYWQGKITKDAFDSAIWEVYRASGWGSDNEGYYWMVNYAQPSDYLRAACMAQENKK